MDIEKAFDSLDHKFLISALEKYGFGKNFISWVKIFLKNQEPCVLNGSTTTKYYLLGRGARQGDPISAYLFILALEILFQLIKSKPEINNEKSKEEKNFYNIVTDIQIFSIKYMENEKPYFRRENCYF